MRGWYYPVRMKRAIATLFIIASGCAQLAPLSEPQAMALVWNQPSVVAFSSRIETESAGKAHGFIRLDSETDNEFVYYVGEDHDDHSICWKWFHVNRHSGAISSSEQ